MVPRDRRGFLSLLVQRKEPKRGHPDTSAGPVGPVPSTPGVLGVALSGIHAAQCSAGHPWPAAPCARPALRRWCRGHRDGSSLRDIAVDGRSAFARCRVATSQNDPCPLRVAESGVARRGRSAWMPSERDQAKDGLFARAPSTSPDSGTCCGEAAAGHPAGTMALVPLAVTKGTRVGRAAPFGSAEVMKRGTREHTALKKGNTEDPQAPIRECDAIRARSRGRPGRRDQVTFDSKGATAPPTPPTDSSAQSDR